MYVCIPVECNKFLKLQILPVTWRNTNKVRITIYFLMWTFLSIFSVISLLFYSLQPGLFVRQIFMKKIVVENRACARRSSNVIVIKKLDL